MRRLLTLLLTSIFIMANAQNKILITANGNTREATLAENKATAALLEMLAEGPVTISMRDYGGFEKVGDLPRSLPTSDKNITTAPGDIMLYLGRSIVIFYGSNSWDYTPLGKLDGMGASEIRSFLDGSPVSVTISLPGHSGLTSQEADAPKASEVYDLSGRKVNADSRIEAGIYIIDGKKRMVR